MSRPPPSHSHSPPSHRAPSLDPHGSPPNNTGGGHTHIRRASTHSIPVSYAYGAPSVGTAGAGKPRTPARTAATGSPSVGSASASTRGGEHEEEQQEAEHEEWTGRSVEPAAVRYARVKQRQKDPDTGQAFPSPAVAVAASLARPLPPGAGGVGMVQNTSVNIATAFRTATAGGGGVRGGGGPRVERREEDDEDGEGEEGIGSGKETHVAGGAAGEEKSRKRKKRSNAPKDPSFKHRQGETTESESGEEEGSKRGKAKKARTVTVEDGEAPPSSSKKSTTSTTRRKSTLPPSDSAPYRPSAQSSTSDSDSGSDFASAGHRHRRRKSKSNGNGRAGGGGSSQAIPIGRRDGEVWFGGKKRRGKGKGKRGGSASASVGVEGEEGEGEEEGEREGEGEGMGGMEEGDFYRPDADEEEGPQEDDEEEATPAPTSYFLRLKSPSPTANANANANTHLSPGPGAHSPFQPSRTSISTTDPTFNAFDHSLAHSSTCNSNSNDFSSSSFHLTTHDRSRRSPSFDASIVSVRTDHDYEEEERIVRVLEEQRRVGGGVQGGGMGLRRRRMPGPPGLGGIREEAATAERGVGVGERLGEGVRPVWRALGRGWQGLRNPLIDWRRVARAVAAVVLLLLLGGSWIYWAMRSTPTPPPPSTPSRSSSWNPFRSSPPPPATPAFTPPTIPADSLPSLITRLTLLESAMGDLSLLTTSDRALTTSNQQLLSRLQSLHSDRQSDHSDLTLLQSNMQSLGKEIASLGSQVAQVSKDVQAGVEGERIARIALEAIEGVLPKRLAVRMDEKGRLEIDPAFWRYLKEAFVGGREVERIVKEEVGRLPNGGGSSSKEKEAQQVIVKEPPSWDDFLAANEVSLRTWVSSDLAARTGADAIVSKRTFVEMLRKELKGLKMEFETKANENVEKIGQELLRKVAKQEEMRKKDSIASHLNPFHRSHSNDPSSITVTTPDGQNLTSIITTLVDSALLRYSKDVLARPDFALYTAGARVIRSLTSPTYSPTPLTRSRRALAWISGTHLPQGRAPITALHPDTSPGACWPFEGQQGQLGIQLSRRIVPSDVSIEHVSVDVAVDGEVRSAPREWEMWGVVEGVEEVRRLEEYRREATAAAAAAGSDDAEALEKALSTSIPPTPNHLLLAHGTYDTTLPSPVQSFPVTSEARQLAIPVQTVVLRVRNNHGERAFTCLYRVRVSGRTEEMISRDGEEEA